MLWLSTKGSFWDQLMIPWLKVQSEVPSNIYHRPSGLTVKIQQRMMTTNLQDFLIGNAEPSRTETQTKNSRRPSLSVSSLRLSSREYLRHKKQWGNCQLEVFLYMQALRVPQSVSSKKRRRDIVRLQCIGFFEDSRCCKQATY